MKDIDTTITVKYGDGPNSMKAYFYSQAKRKPVSDLYVMKHYQALCEQYHQDAIFMALENEQNAALTRPY